MNKAELETRVAELEAQIVAGAVKVENLEIALVSSRRIGAAIGILMTVRQVSEDQAFGLLRTASQTRNRKLREVAEDVILTGDTSRT